MLYGKNRRLSGFFAKMSNLFFQQVGLNFVDGSAKQEIKKMWPECQLHEVLEASKTGRHIANHLTCGKHNDTLNKIDNYPLITD